jgi:gliding motility-associated-like protein
MKIILTIITFFLFVSLFKSQQVLRSYDFFMGESQFETTNSNAMNVWCIENSIYSIDEYSLQICSNGAIGYSGENGSTAISYFEVNAENYSNMTLEFDWRCNGEANHDFGSVLYSVGGIDLNSPIWNILESNFQTGDNATNHAIIKLPLITNNKSSLKIGFAFTSDEYFNFQPGFVLDNIQLKGFQCAGNYPIAPAQQNPFVTCFDAIDNFYLSIAQVTGLNYRWYLNETQAFFFSGGTLLARMNEDQSYIVTSINSQGCESRSPHTVVDLDVIPKPRIELVELLATNVGNDGAIEIDIVGDAPPFDILWMSENNDSLYYNSLRIDSLSAGIYSVTVKDNNSCDSVRYFNVEEGSLLKVPSAFSPNADGLNDFWIIEGIQQWRDFELSVYTMSNRIVHAQVGEASNEGYIEWGGSNMYTNELLPDGDYFYVLSSEEKKRKYRGIVSIKTK